MIRMDSRLVCCVGYVRLYPILVVHHAAEVMQQGCSERYCPACLQAGLRLKCGVRMGQAV